jgi:hypothetical protein
LTEVPLPVKFLFLLIGPTMEEYLEVGRSLSTLFSTSVSKKKIFNKDFYIFIEI